MGHVTREQNLSASKRVLIRGTRISASGGRFSLMKYRLTFFGAFGLALIGLATAQSSQVHSSSAKSTSDPLQAATKPLTPKSAMPSSGHKSSAAVLPPSTNVGKTNAELSRVEREKIKTGPSTSASKDSPKLASAPKSNEANPAINYKYQKPVGGLKATTPDANAKGSSTPRVTKKN